MDKFGSVDELLDFAVQKEEEANKFYTDLAVKMDRPAMRQVFEGFAKEELDTRKNCWESKQASAWRQQNKKSQTSRLAITW